MTARHPGPQPMTLKSRSNEELEQYWNPWGENWADEHKYPLGGPEREPYPPDFFDWPISRQFAWLRWRDRTERRRGAHGPWGKGGT
jgi:hypothetical protein